MLQLEILEERTVPSLTAVAATAGFPFTAIVQVKMTFPDSKVFVGTGAMVDSFHVLTAGHNVYEYGDGGWAKKIEVTPELNGTTAPFGLAYMTRERTYTTWTDYSKVHPGSTAPGDYDIGLITLDRQIGLNTGWMSFGYNNTDSFFSSGRVMNLAGYPATNGYDGKHMGLTSGTIAGLDSTKTVINYNQSQMTTYGGMSGGPVWSYLSSTGQRIIYGVHVAGTGTSTSLNFATRITQGIFNDLLSWERSDVKPVAKGPRPPVPKEVLASLPGSTPDPVQKSVEQPRTYTDTHKKADEPLVVKAVKHDKHHLDELFMEPLDFLVLDDGLKTV